MPVDLNLILGLGVGLLLGWALYAWRNAARSVSKQDFEKAVAEKEFAATEIAQLRERAAQRDEQLGESKRNAESLRGELSSTSRELATSQERIRAQDERIAAQKSELEDVQKKLATEFENLATRILEENTKKFVGQNRESLDKLLMPLQEKLTSFREKVEKSHEQQIKDRAELGEQLRGLSALNRTMTDEARNLTKALKGDSKTQGNWGELILTTILEKSGLVCGQEYHVQKSFADEDGRRFQPDVTLTLPEGKHLVVDSKVSLVAYERCVNAADDAERETAQKDHLTSLRTHIGELSKKSYESLYGIHSPDFVLMFVPIEPAFTLAMQVDDGLFDFAFRQNVVMVTPSTLFATLRTVANIWRQEKQNRNVLEIARKSGDLYDKFVGFFEDMQEIGNRIGKSQETYDKAMNKLRSGKGNLVRRVEEIKQLGARAKKELPEDIVEEALLEESPH